MKFTLSILTFCSMLLLADQARATPERPAVEKLLWGIEYVPNAEALKRLGPGVDQVLIAIASDDKSHGLPRIRAIYAIGMVPSVAGRDFLRSLIADKQDAAHGLNLGMLKAAARTLGNFGPSVATDLLPLLTHPVADLRSASAEGLAKSRSPYARAALQQRILAERDTEVRRTIERSLAVLARGGS